MAGKSLGMGRVIQEMLIKEPFVPFIIVMNSGDRYEVRYPGLVGTGKDLLTIARSKSQRHDVLRLTEISVVEVLDPE
ncbi:MAG TPA: hypothetical protein VGG19_17445 [Tepidisphaeraceae bacterium]|jgi:hypothetical protein